MSEELWRCPFCGAEAKYYETISGTQYAVCSDEHCFMNGCGCYAKISPAEWNTRPLEDALQQKLDEAMNARIEEERIEQQHQETGLYFDSEVE